VSHAPCSVCVTSAHYLHKHGCSTRMLLQRNEKHACYMPLHNHNRTLHAHTKEQQSISTTTKSQRNTFPPAHPQTEHPLSTCSTVQRVRHHTWRLRIEI